MVRSGRISSRPLLPVKPERYRRLGLNATKRQSSWRSFSAAATVRRRCAQALSSTLQFPGKDLSALREGFRLAHVIVLLRLFGESHEVPDAVRNALLVAFDAAPVETLQRL